MELALSLQSQYEVNRAILSRPVSTLARMRGLKVDDVFDRLIPELAKKNLTEVLRYAEVGLRYIGIVDRNRLREELGPRFIIAVDMIINSVQEGLDSNESWIKRKAMNMHGDLIDEQAEKQRFVDVIMTEKKIEMLRESKEKISKLEEEIAKFESKGTIIDTIVEDVFYPLVVYGQY
ncbi:MAG: hypothetical protein WC998_05580 [Candidatus Paceibacterota bacterium]|jgi:hypothetical protein